MSVPPGTFRHPHRARHRCPVHAGPENLDRPLHRRAAVYRSGGVPSGGVVSSQGAVVVVGSGQAGGRAAEALRQGGHTDRITLIGDERHAPYERPALSKEFLNSAAAEKLAWVRPATWYADSGVTALHGRKAVAIDQERSVVELDEGSPVEFHTLILTTGARPRQLTVEGADHPRVSYLRTIEDSQQ